jgi:hypothetical protein
VGPFVAIVAMLFVILVMPIPALASLAGIVAGGYAAGRAAKVKGARWYAAAGALSYLLVVVITILPLLFWGPQIS